MDLTVIINTMIMLLFLMILGFILAKKDIIDDHTSTKLCTLVLNVTMPAMILASVKTGASTIDLFGSIAAGIGFYAFAIVMAIILTLVLPFKKEEKKLYRFMFVFANVSFMGYPIVGSIYGDSAVFMNSLVHLPFNLLVFSYGITLFAKNGEKLNFKKLVNLGIIASLLAVLLAVFRIQLPDVAFNCLNTVGTVTTPLSMLIIGASLSKVPFKAILSDKSAWLMSLFRLILLPLGCFFLFGLFIKDKMLLGVVSVTMAMPPASMAVMFTKEYNRYMESAASRAVVLSTVLSMVTIPIIAYVFGIF